jgi:hypothetical protein
MSKPRAGGKPFVLFDISELQHHFAITLAYERSNWAIAPPLLGLLLGASWCWAGKGDRRIDPIGSGYPVKLS